MSSTETLDGAALGLLVRIVALHLDEESAAWLAAVGIAPGEECIVLRRAALGGPLHVRLVSGGEFAVAREIARKLDVTRVST